MKNLFFSFLSFSFGCLSSSSAILWAADRSGSTALSGALGPLSIVGCFRLTCFHDSGTSPCVPPGVPALIPELMLKAMLAPPHMLTQARGTPGFGDELLAIRALHRPPPPSCRLVFLPAFASLVGHPHHHSHRGGPCRDFPFHGPCPRGDHCVICLPRHLQRPSPSLALAWHREPPADPPPCSCAVAAGPRLGLYGVGA